MNVPFPTPRTRTRRPAADATRIPRGQTGRVSRGKALLLDRASQFRPGPPPALDSNRYREGLAEMARVRAVGSETRTQAQTDTAEFWYQSSVLGFTGALRAHPHRLEGITSPTAPGWSPRSM